MDEPRVIQVDAAEPVHVVALDVADTVPTPVYVPGTGSSSGVSDDELVAALEPYATRTYVDAAVATGGDITGVQGLIDTTLAIHRDHPTPHPTYDTMRSLTLLFENRLV